LPGESALGGSRDEQIRKAGLYEDKPAELVPSNTLPPDNSLELDEELFSALGAQLGGENESLRNLLLDANAKIGELDAIKNAVGELVDPVSKALRAFEAEKSEKISLQTVLSNTRTAYGKLRNEVAELEKKSSFSGKECQALRQELTTTQNLLRTLEAMKAEIAIDIAARRRRSWIWKRDLRKRQAKAKRCARKIADWTNDFRHLTNAWRHLSPRSTEPSPTNSDDRGRKASAANLTRQNKRRSGPRLAQIRRSGGEFNGNPRRVASR
jgi:chromosome segregation ATPase